MSEKVLVLFIWSKKNCRARNVNVTGKEMGRVWGNPWRKTFAISIIFPPMLGGQGLIS